MSATPTDRLLLRLRNALTLYELSRANGTVKDGALVVLVRDALEMHEADCDDAQRADEMEWSQRKEEGPCF